jgi:hypothetical protein
MHDLFIYIERELLEFLWRLPPDFIPGILGRRERTSA